MPTDTHVIAAEGFGGSSRYVYKYHLASVEGGALGVGSPDVVDVDMPYGAVPRAVGVQGPDVVLWAEVLPTAPVRRRRFRLAKTGQDLGTVVNHRYVGTVMLFDGGYVVHVYDVTDCA